MVQERTDYLKLGLSLSSCGPVTTGPSILLEPSSFWIQSCYNRPDPSYWKFGKYPFYQKFGKFPFVAPTYWNYPLVGQIPTSGDPL